MPPPKQTFQILARALDGAAQLAVVDETTQADDDRITVDLEVRGRRLRLHGLWAGDGRPHEVRSAIRSMPSVWPEDVVVVARQLSKTSLDLLRERDANWADETGEARIVGAGVVVVRDAEDSTPRRRDFTWSASVLDIGEALLSRAWPEGVRTGDLARITGWSPAQVTEVLQAFDSRGWTVKYGPQRGPGSRRALDAAEELLTAWASAVTDEIPERRLAHAVGQDPLELLRGDLGESLNEHVHWALTGWAATELIAPVMTSIPSLQIYVAEDDFYGPLSDAIRATDLREVDEGGAIEFWSSPSGPLALSEPHEDLMVVSGPRIYADLLRLGGRGEDAAEHIRQEVIAPMHRPLSAPPPKKSLLTWEEASRSRIEQLVAESGEPDPYSVGSWSASYRIQGTSRNLFLPALRDVLSEVTGRETGWPAWWIPSDESRPRVAGGTIETWISPKVLVDPSSRDFWRADPRGLLFLRRGFEEDGAIDNLELGTVLDLTLPVWRVGECLLHAARLAERLDGDRIEFMMRWEGLRGRELRSVASRDRVMFDGGVSVEDSVMSHIEVPAAAVLNQLPDAVRALVEPLYTVFDFFQPPDSLYREELGKLLGTPPASWGP